MAGPKFMQSYASGEIPPEQQGPEAFKTMLGYMGMGGGLTAVGDSQLMNQF